MKCEHMFNKAKDPTCFYCGVRKVVVESGCYNLKEMGGTQITRRTKMAENEKPVMQSGTWDNIDVSERKEQVKWLGINESHTLTFLCERPREIPLKDGGVFYVFDVSEDKVLKDVATSAFTLLRGLKEHAPLLGKTLKITKVIKEGKQQYVMEEVEGGSEDPSSNVFTCGSFDPTQQIVVEDVD